MFALEKVTKSYPSRRGLVYALRDVSLAIAPRSFVTVTGPSGSGKSTLLLALGGLIRPTSGRILFQGTDLGSLGERGLAAYRNGSVGFVLQSFNLIPYLSAYENVMVPMSLGASGNNNHGRRARNLLDRLGLSDRMDHLPRELSIGQQQRVAMARALGNDPKVILADEPTGNLDPALAAEILNILRDLNLREGRTVVMVTHSPEAARIGTHRVHLDAGRCSAIGGVAPAGIRLTQERERPPAGDPGGASP
jgi:putative ABC transport system ATP-binding protein